MGFVCSSVCYETLIHPRDIFPAFQTKAGRFSYSNVQRHFRLDSFAHMISLKGFKCLARVRKYNF